MAGIERLLAIMARLRDPQGGCPWDLEQDFASIAPYTIEEAYEVEDAIRRGDLDDLRDELGDLLLQVVFHAQMAREAGHFGFDGVVEAICQKLVRRHPHVFADAEIGSAEAQLRAWEDHKAAERGRRAGPARSPSALDHLARGLPALLRAAKLQRRAARSGLDWPETGDAPARLEQAAMALVAAVRHGGTRARGSRALGELLFAAASLARHLDLDPEQALREANAGFERRFRAVEVGLAAEGRRPETLSPAEWRVRWREASPSQDEAG